MNISELCIKRPVFATVLSLILIVIGLVGFNYLNTRFFPKFEAKRIYINASYSGASAKLIETSITTPIEDAIGGISGIDTIQSTSSQGSTRVKLTLKPNADRSEVASQVRNKIAMIQSELPDTVKTPTVQAGWGSMELMDIGFVSKDRSPENLRDYLDRYVTDQIEQVSGVANLEIYGANKYAMRIWLNPQKIASRHLSVTDVINAIKASNVELPAGSLKGKYLSFPITATTKLKTATQFDNIIIENINGRIVRLKDIGYAKLSANEDSDTIVRINGQPGVNLQVYTTEDANPIAVAKHINTLLNTLRAQLPSDITAQITYSQASFMQSSVHEVYEAIIIAILSVIFIIFVFLGRIRTVLVPVATIPVCLIATFGVIYFLGFSINVITLLAIVLSIGLVVDDAIVMLENIYRHIEAGMKPLAAAIQGSREMTFAIVATTLTLAAVYAPIGLVKGRGATIFQSFAFTLAGAVIISGFVALTLSPMMCARVLGEKSVQTSRYTDWLNRFFQHLKNYYARFLEFILRHRLKVVALSLLIAIGGFFLMKDLPHEFLPQEDMGFIFSVLNMPQGTTPEHNATELAKLTHIYLKIPAVESTTSFSSSGAKAHNFLFAKLKPYADRKLTAMQAANLLNTKVKQVPGLNAASFAPKFGGNSQAQLRFIIMSDSNYRNLYSASSRLIKALKKYPGLRDIHSNLNFDSQQYRLTINREAAGQMQVSVNDIDTTLADLLGGNDISSFTLEGKNYDVYVQAKKSYLHSLKSIEKFKVKNAQGQLIPLGNLVNITPTLAQPTLMHFDRLRAAQISAQLGQGYKLGQVVQYLQTNLPTLLPTDDKYAFIGQAKRMLDSSKSMGMIFLLGLVFIYLVLSAQFESFIDPFIILLSVPLSIVGAMLGLKLMGGSLNIYTEIGLVTLIGLIAKHGILITSFANRLRDEYKDAKAALIEAASIRLRPILMTTAAMIFGTLPLLFTSGASAASRAQIAMVIISGLFFGTFFSLILVPITYSYAASLKNWHRQARERKANTPNAL